MSSSTLNWNLSFDGDGSKKKERPLCLHNGPNGIIRGRKSKMVNHIAAATCDTPFNFLKRKEHQKKSRVTRFPQSFVARTWQTQDQSRGETDMAAIAPPLFLNAASSGFSLSATCPPSSFTGILHLSRSFNLNLPGLYVIHPTGNTSQSPTSSAIAACLLRKVRVLNNPEVGITWTRPWKADMIISSRIYCTVLIRLGSLILLLICNIKLGANNKRFSLFYNFFL